MAHDLSSTANLTLEQTNDIAMSIDDVLKERQDIAKVLTSDNIERSLLLKELLMNAYVRGFFAGIQHAMNDLASAADHTKTGH